MDEVTERCDCFYVLYIVSSFGNGLNLFKQAMSETHKKCSNMLILIINRISVWVIHHFNFILYLSWYESMDKDDILGYEYCCLRFISFHFNRRQWSLMVKSSFNGRDD